jgi:hypothetical protein
VQRIACIDDGCAIEGEEEGGARACAAACAAHILQQLNIGP